MFVLCFALSEEELTTAAEYDPAEEAYHLANSFGIYPL